MDPGVVDAVVLALPGHDLARPELSDRRYSLPEHLPASEGVVAPSAQALARSRIIRPTADSTTSVASSMTSGQTPMEWRSLATGSGHATSTRRPHRTHHPQRRCLHVLLHSAHTSTCPRCSPGCSEACRPCPDASSVLLEAVSRVRLEAGNAGSLPSQWHAGCAAPSSHRGT